MDQTEEIKSADEKKLVDDETPSDDETPATIDKKQPAVSTNLSKWKEQFSKLMGEAINETCSITEPELRIKNILDYLSSANTETVAKILSPEPDCKNAELSSEYRAKGDYHYCLYSRRPNEISDNLEKAHQFYTKSIAYAPEKSLQLSLAHANRSAVLFRAKLYTDCKLDIQQSIKNGYPSELRANIHLREAMCDKILNENNDLIEKKIEEIHQWIEKMEEESRDSFRKIVNNKMAADPIDKSQFPKWNYDNYVPKLENVNKKINGLSDLVKLKYSQDYGRHMVAAKDIKIGDVIGVVEPYAKIYYSNMAYKYCCHCGEQTWSSVPCSGCPLVVFCSENCRDEAVKEYHDIECPVFQSMKTAGMKDEMFLVARIVAKAIKDVGDSLDYHTNLDKDDKKIDPLDKSFKNEKFDSTNFSNIYKFLGHPLKSQLKLTIYGYPILVSYLFVTMTNTFCKRFSVSLYNLKHDPKFISLIILTQNIMQLNTANSISIMTRHGNDKKEALIHGLYPAINFFNHSCQPTIVSSLQGHAQLILTAIKPIKKGKRLFFDYGNNSVNKATSEEQGVQIDLLDKYSTTSENLEIKEVPSIKLADKLTNIKRKLQDAVSIVDNFGKTNDAVPDVSPTIHEASELFKKIAGGKEKNSTEFLDDVVHVLESFYQNFNAPCVKLSGEQTRPEQTRLEQINI